MPEYLMTPGLARHLLALLDEGADIGASSTDIIAITRAAELDREPEPIIEEDDPYQPGDLCTTCGVPADHRCDTCGNPICRDHAAINEHGVFCFQCAIR